MDVKVYLMQKSGVITDVTFTSVDAVIYEKANHNNGQPDLLIVQDKVKGTDWSEYEHVAEFKLSDVVGWADVSHLPKEDK